MANYPIYHQQLNSKYNIKNSCYSTC